MKISISLIALVLFTKSFAQNFNFTEQYHWGSTKDEYLKDVEKTSDGGFIFLSETNLSPINNNTFTDTLYGAVDMWLVRLDANKNVVWNKTFGGTGLDFGIDLIKLNNGNYLIMGYSDSPISGNKTALNYGGYDAWVICINENGEILWQKTYGTDLDDGINNASELTNNKITFFVGTSGGISGNKSLPSKGGTDGWLVTIDTLGVILNEKVFGGNGNDGFSKIEKLNNSHYLLLGRSESGISGDKNSDNFGDYDAWLLEVDTSFVIVNQFAFGGSFYEFTFNFIKETIDSYYFSTSSGSQPSGNKTSPKRCLVDDVVLLRIDKNYNILNEVSFGHSSASSYRINQQLVLPNNEIVLAGSVNGNASPYNSQISHGRDIWLMQVDDNLNQNWNYSFGSIGNDNFIKGFVNSNFELELFGDFSSQASYDFYISTYGSGYSDVFLATLSSDLSLVESQLAVGVYPNPSSGLFTIQCATPIDKYAIYSLDGRLQKRGEKLIGTLDLQSLPTGTYFGQFVTGKSSRTVKFIIN